MNKQCQAVGKLSQGLSSEKGVPHCACFAGQFFLYPHQKEPGPRFMVESLTFLFSELRLLLVLALRSNYIAFSLQIQFPIILF